MLDLYTVLDKYSNCIKSKDTLKAYLDDLFPEEKKEINALIKIYECGIAKKIKEKGFIETKETDVYIAKLEKEYSVPKQYAKNGIKKWEKTLADLKKNNKEKFTRLRFEEKYLFYTQGGVPEFELMDIDDNNVEISKFLLYDMENLVVPAKLNEKKVIGIGKKACNNHIEITSLKISDGIQYIDAGAFANCINLKNVILPDTLKRIGRVDEYNEQYTFFSKNIYLGTFANCAIDNIRLPESLEIIGENTFRSCKNLRKIHLPTNIIKVGKYCFHSCRNLENVIISNAMHEIEMGVFYDCSSLKSITISENIKRIKQFAFQQCSSLSEVKLNEGLKEIGISAFRGCGKLKKILIPKTVSNMHKFTFDYSADANLILSCFKQTFAWGYAKKYGIKMEQVSD